MSQILIADDDTVLRDLLAAHLEGAGHTVLVADNGLSALETVKRDSPDLVILDMNMPELTGWETLRVIKAGTASGNTPIIALSAHATAGDKDEAYDAGCDLYMAKPVTPDQLLGAVRDLLG